MPSFYIYRGIWVMVRAGVRLSFCGLCASLRLLFCWLYI
nr:MAG TPA: hypothetical protein [Caudoviricetes sp.]